MLFLFAAAGILYMFINPSDANSPKSSSKNLLTENQSKSMDAYWKAKAASEARDYQKALDHLDNALELDPENSAALMRSTMVHSLIGDYETAIIHIEKAQTVLRKQGKYESANNLEIEKLALQKMLQDNDPSSSVLK